MNKSFTNRILGIDVAVTNLEDAVELIVHQVDGIKQDKDKSHFLLHFISFNKYVAGTYTNTILPAVLFLAILPSCCFYRWCLGSAILR